MPVSQNGWSANDRSVIETYIVGRGMRVALRSGDAGYLLKHFTDWFDANIKDVDENYNNGELDDWGYAERPIRGGLALSNHASGTAIDINATEWPLGSEASVYLTQAEIDKVHKQLLVYEGCIRWGQDYVGRKDPMHFEINTGAAEVARVAAKLRQQLPPAPEGGDDEMMLIRNSKGTVAILTDFAVWVPDAASNKGLLAAGLKTAQVSDAFFDTLVAQANRDETDLTAIRKAVERIDARGATPPVV